MPIPTLPTTEEVQERIVSAIESTIGQATPTFYKAFNTVISIAFSLMYTLLYKYGQDARKQIFTVTQDDESLELKGAQYDIPRVAATSAQHTATVTGDIGVVILQGALYRGGANGLVYATDASVELITTTATATLTCLTAGEAGTLLVGDTLTIQAPQAGLDNVATVASVVVEGEDRETIEQYRARISAREKQPPQGGSLFDYLAWAKEVPGVVRAFAWGKREESSITEGHVEVYPIMADDDPDGRIPTTAKLTEVEAYIDDPSRAPTQCVAIDVLAMTERGFTIDITALSPDTADIRTAIEDNLTDWLYSREPQQFVDQVEVKDTISRSWVEAICIQSGAESVTLTIAIDTAPTTPIEDHTLDYDELAKIDTVSFP